MAKSMRLTKTDLAKLRFVVTMTDGTRHTIVSLTETDAREFTIECYPNDSIAAVANLGAAYPWED